MSIVQKHASTHKALGSDPINIKELGGMTAQEIRSLLNKSQIKCTGTGIDMLAILGRYARLDNSGKIDPAVLPDYIAEDYLIPYISQYPGTLKEVDNYDSIYVIKPGKVIGAQVSISEPPVGGPVVVELSFTGGDPVSIELAEGSKYNSIELAVGEEPSLDVGFNIQVSIKQVGTTEPGEFLTVRAITQIIRTN